MQGKHLAVTQIHFFVTWSRTLLLFSFTSLIIYPFDDGILNVLQFRYSPSVNVAIKRVKTNRFCCTRPLCYSCSCCLFRFIFFFLLLPINLIRLQPNLTHVHTSIAVATKLHRKIGFLQSLISEA